MQAELVELVLELVKELGEEEDWSISDVDQETVLYGDGGVLDSMWLVSLVVAMEQAVADKYGKTIGLADEKAMSQSRSPYRTAGRLAEYAESQLKES